MMNLEKKRFELRIDILNMVYAAKAGHIGGDFSVCDILTVLYYKHMNISPDRINYENRDRFILSKGHSVEAYYSILADCGFFPKEELKTFSQYGTKFIGHPNNHIPGIEMNSGSLGHGLPVSIGMALAGKMSKKDYRVYTVMGDGELAEGSIWEGAMAAGHFKLDNLCAVVDRNGLQISGTTEVVMTQRGLHERFESFGWHVIECDGNDLTSLDTAFTRVKTVKDKPSLIIANTTKGFPVSFMQNDKSWHHRIPNAEEYTNALKELEQRKEDACK